MSEHRATASLVDIGSALGCGLLAAMLGAGPAALRLSAHAGSERSFLLLAAAATPFTFMAVLILRQTFTGLRAIIGKPESGDGQRAFSRMFVSLWLLTFAPILFSLGALLRAMTHHRPLAGVTFAVVALVVLFVSALLAGRISHLVERLRATSPRASATVAFVAYALVVALVLLAARALPKTLPVESASTMVDVAALSLASALAARPELRRVRLLGVIGPLAAILVVALGLTRVGADLLLLVTDRAPAFAALLSALPLDLPRPR